MGTFTPKPAEPPPKQKDKEGAKPLLPPLPADFSAKYKHLLVEHSSDFVEVEEDPDQQLVHSNAPIVNDSTFLETKPVFAEVTCLDPITNARVKNYAWVVHPFEAVYTRKEGNCSEGGQLRVLKPDVSYIHFEEVRAFGRFMFGKVEETCTKKWNWWKGGSSFEFRRLRAGNVLFVEFFNAFTGKIRQLLVTVKKVHHS